MGRWLLLLSLCASTVTAQQAPAIIPLPVHVSVSGGSDFVITATTRIRVVWATLPIGHQLAAWLAPATGFWLPVVTDENLQDGDITLSIGGDRSRLGPEGYTLSSSRRGVEIRAAEPAGVFYGVQTLRQLLPPPIFRDAELERASWRVPAVRIEDWPRFAWRGAHLDVARHFMPKEFVKRYIDLLALHKLNTFHWHLTDDQGWRIEILKYPRLTQVGAWRRETMIPPFNRDPAKRRYDGIPHGGYYTQDDIREIVAYAAARYVNVVPEIEMPGHSVAAIAAYPQLGVTGEAADVVTYWGVFENILNADDATIAFYQDVLTEVMGLFPSKFIHVGGDEAAKKLWDSSPSIRARIRALGLKDSHELQSWFIRQMDTFLASHGRRLIGWDEILEGGLAPGATVMSWRGVAGGIAAARQGHDVVMTPTRNTYLDYYQSQERTREPVAIGGFLPIDSVYAFDPYPAGLEERFRSHVLGAQVQLWTEYVPTPHHAEYMAYPRTSALSEVVWTPLARKDIQDFRRRLAVHVQRLDALGVHYRPLDGSPWPAGIERR